MNFYKQTAALRKTNPNALFFAMPLMTNSFGQKRGYGYYQSINYQNQYCLSSKAAEPEKLLAFMNWCYSEEGMLVNTYGRKNVDYKVDKNGNPYVPESVWKKYGATPAGEYQWMSTLGLGQLCFAPTWTWQGLIRENYPDDEEYGMDFNKVTAADMKAGHYDILPTVEPDVSTKTLSRADAVNSFILSNVVKFISGSRPMSEYDAFVADLKRLGAEDVVKEYNTVGLTVLR